MERERGSEGLAGRGSCVHCLAAAEEGRRSPEKGSESAQQASGSPPERSLCLNMAQSPGELLSKKGPENLREKSGRIFGLPKSVKGDSYPILGVRSDQTELKN